MEFLAKLQTYATREKKRFQKDSRERENFTLESHESTTVSSVGIFHGARNLEDVLILQYCGEKFRQWCMGVQEEKQKRLKDGVIIQVQMQESNQRIYSTRVVNKCFTIPFIMRIPSNMTVYELRVAIGKRLSRVIAANNSNGVVSHESSPAVDEERPSLENDRVHRYCNGHDRSHYFESTKKPKFSSESELKHFEFPTALMTRIPMTYQNTNQTSHTKEHRLGCLELESYTTQQQQSATSENVDEAVVVSDLLGRGSGRVLLHFPPSQSMDYSFNLDEWELVESFTPGEDKDDSAGNYGINLLSCIEKYCQKEQLEETEMWYCNRCKAHVRAWKHIHLYRAPPILIVHLKRFHYSSTTHRRDKIDVHVDFPLKGLDLRSYVLHWENGQEPIYDCFAVSNHYGGLGGGHYTAYALNHGKWCHFDDSVVTGDVSESDVVSNAAYVLYYRRREGNKAASDIDDERMVLDHELQNYVFPPASITTDTSSHGSLDEGFVNCYQKDDAVITV